MEGPEYTLKFYYLIASNSRGYKSFLRGAIHERLNLISSRLCGVGNSGQGQKGDRIRQFWDGGPVRYQFR